MNIVKLIQGSLEWHEHRKRHRNASQTPAVLGLSPWMTPFQLWEIKTGRAPQPEVTAAMAHGTKLEPMAREAYEQLYRPRHGTLGAGRGRVFCLPRRNHA
jgi:putative phage-type endonuclease